MFGIPASNVIWTESVYYLNDDIFCLCRDLLVFVVPRFKIWRSEQGSYGKENPVPKISRAEGGYTGWKDAVLTVQW